MIKRATFSQPEPAQVWEVRMEKPEHTRGRPLAAYDTNGDSIDIDSWEFEDGVLRVNFGLDPASGELDYEYQAPDDSIVINGDGGVINITINQTNGADEVAPAPVTFQ